MYYFELNDGSPKTRAKYRYCVQLRNTVLQFILEFASFVIESKYNLSSLMEMYVHKLGGSISLKTDIPAESL